MQQEGSLRGLSPVLPVHAAFSGSISLGGKASATQGHEAMGEPVRPQAFPPPALHGHPAFFSPGLPSLFVGSPLCAKEET